MAKCDSVTSLFDEYAPLGRTTVATIDLLDGHLYHATELYFLQTNRHVLRPLFVLDMLLHKTPENVLDKSVLTD
jgi:hypothetical protein